MWLAAGSAATIRSGDGNDAIHLGSLATPEDLRTYHRMLTETTAVVQKRIDAGDDLDAVQAAGLPGWEEWGSGFISTERWLETLYRSLTD